MANRDLKKKVISKWNRGCKGLNGSITNNLAQVVYTEVVGRNKKGKEVRISRTRHERIS